MEKVCQSILSHPAQSEDLDTSYNLAVADMQKPVPDCYTAVAFVGMDKRELIAAWAKAFVAQELPALEEDTDLVWNGQVVVDKMWDGQIVVDKVWDGQVVVDKVWKDTESKAVAFQKTQVHHS